MRWISSSVICLELRTHATMILATCHLERHLVGQLGVWLHSLTSQMVVQQMLTSSPWEGMDPRPAWLRRAPKLTNALSCSLLSQPSSSFSTCWLRSCEGFVMSFTFYLLSVAWCSLSRSSRILFTTFLTAPQSGRSSSYFSSALWFGCSFQFLGISRLLLW